MDRYQVKHIYDEHDAGHSLRWEAAQLAFRRFLKWAENCRRNPYAKKTALITPRGSADPELQDIPRARYLELLEAGNELISFDKIKLTGPNIAWTVDEFCQQSYELETVDLPGSRIIAENCGNNRFSVSVENVRSFAIYLAPQMGDISKEFTVDCGKHGVFTLIPEPVTGEPLIRCISITLSLYHSVQR